MDRKKTIDFIVLLNGVYSSLICHYYRFFKHAKKIFLNYFNLEIVIKSQLEIKSNSVPQL